MTEHVSPLDFENARAELGYDPDALREKYRQERDKRLRAEGARQYKRITPDLAHFVDDPYTPRIEREPVRDEMDVVVIGGGFGGLQIAARLRQAGVERIRIIEKGGDVGGVWYWNRYPGAACDTEAYVYMPLLEETGYIPTERYAKGPEIWEQAQRIARTFDLYRDALLQTGVTDLRWEEDESRWVISTDRADEVRARFVCVTTGAFTTPKLPGIEGLETFRGHAFHTTRWDYAYTGGDSTGNLVGLQDKRVAVIGTGATSIQCIPHLGRWAEHLYVFQRTPSAVDDRNNQPTDPEWVKTLRPGWQRERMENFSACIVGEDVESDLVGDGWTKIIRRFRTLKDGADDEAAMEQADFQQMEAVRARVDAHVRDQTTAEVLKPYYRALCKRPCFHDEYLDTFNRPNVTLVDTHGKGVQLVSPNGIVVDGVEYPVDCIIFASGFQTGGSMRSRLGYEIHGRDGLTPMQKWSEGMTTFYGMQMRGFPNFFLVSMSQVGVSSNQTHVLDVQARHIAYVIQQTCARGEDVLVEPTAEAEDAWVQEVIRASRANLEFLESCTPGYYNNEGQPNIDSFRRNGPYSPGIMAFSRIIDAWREEGSLKGLELTSR